MASVPEQRNILVQQYIPKLIRQLTGFSTSDENFKICLQFAFSHFKHHRFLSVNSHEVKRDMDGICEKLRFSNFHDIEKKFKKIVEETVTHELAVDHYEKDVIYAILNLLTTLAYDPIGNLKTKHRQGEDVITFMPALPRIPKTSEAFISTLLKDNFKLLKNDTDSELSEWTDSDDDAKDDDTHSEATVEENVTPSKFASSLKPPQKPPVFTTVTVKNPEKWLRDNIQHSWWTDDITAVGIKSPHPTANFCVLWQKHLSDKSLGFIKPRPLSLVSEYCLLREIFWMFSNPVDCKFFCVNDDEIVLRNNVTLPSTMPESLHIFLGDFLRSINLMFRMKTDYQKSLQSSTISHTVETYFKVVQSILERIMEFILEEEETVKEQRETYTIVTLHNNIRPHAKMLEMLWSIHSSSILDDLKFPPHICSTFLIASLNLHVQTSCSKEKKSLAISMLMTCLKTFLEIFEIWWTEARLDDLKQEFLMEKCSENDLETFRPRLLEKSKEKSFFLNDSVSKKIRADPIICIMLNYAINASFTLDIISKLDRIHEMRQIVNDSTSLYEELVERVGKEIKKFSSNGEGVDDAKSESGQKSNFKNQQLVEEIRSGMVANGDDILLLAFQSTFDRLYQTKSTEPKSSSINLSEVLNQATSFLLVPLEHSIQRIIKDLLHKKISIAERFVMNIYKNEFHIVHQLQEIRRVFFIESNELINFFYSTLFPQMEDDEPAWANPYLLTVAFNDAICNHRQQSPTLFSVEVNRKLGRHTVLDAIDELTVFFNINQNLVNIYTQKSMSKYNQVFRFLLKIKWSQRVLSCLRYPDFFRHRAPYAKLQMLDLVIKRLSLTRFAMQHSINSLHNHLMVMLQGLSLQLDEKVIKAQNISELISHHEAFVDDFFEKSFLGPNSANLFGIIIELLKLAKVLKDEWSNVTAFASLDESGCVDSISLGDLNNNTVEIEKAFGVCEYQLKVLLDV